MIILSKYTTQLRFICESLSGETDNGYNNVDTIIEKSAPLIFDFDYPIHETSYRDTLNQKIIRHYYTREICEESYGLWHLRLKMRMLDIMPYYAKLYESAQLEFNPLNDTDITTTENNANIANNKYKSTYKGNGENNTENETTTNSNTSNNDNNKRVTGSGKTPQGSLTNVEELKYLSEASVDKYENESTTANEETNNSNSKSTYSDTSTDESQNDSTLNETKQKNVTGKTGSTSYSQMLKEYRETILNIDYMVIEELSTLFFGLWE